MKNITFSADDSLIAQARGLAQLRGTTLNEEFRLWLQTYAAQQGEDMKKIQTRSLLDQLTAPSAGQPFVPATYMYTPAHRRPAVREALSEREQRMLARLDGAAAPDEAAPGPAQ
jgi:hypothetical protein